MKFAATGIEGVVRVSPEPARDGRGFFARLHCADEFARAGHPFAPAQTSLSRNDAALTLRGMHWRAAPFAETKLVRVVRGAAFDVAVDLRPGSPTFRAWVGARLDAAGGDALLVPPGCAHGFLTLEEGTDVLYQIDRAYAPGHDRGFRWDDPAAGIDWPAAPAVVSARDATWPPLG
ncbi:MAG: dTDP-4-dehydrorhamnose 3,5-epimerase family protein [Hyphomicrobiales bacterium]|nr:dTDP-4-dehydrorhamnose 3,5-epimerase family protein [Hyphomicrobiales bacterium]MDE2016822.1 dTDP-4-dehydrorhamnose 3,5-epimerase family protein [Hyphomicrobiales bacterium]